MNTSQSLEDLEIAVKAANAAWLLYQDISKSTPKIMEQIDREIKIDLDFLLEACVIDTIQGHSDWPIVSEESLRWTGNDDNFWIVDPLDGSFNCLRGLPHFGVSIALCAKKTPILGVIIDFAHGDVFKGVVGSGAWINDSRIRVSQIESFGQAVLCTGFPAAFDFSSAQSKRAMGIYEKFLKVRMFGSAAISLCYVACGRCDVYWEDRIRLWDVAAGVALVRASGGVVEMSEVDNDCVLNVTAAANSGLLPSL
jgi:myo-inositol-1(or 4)-monophosphatase